MLAGTALGDTLTAVLWTVLAAFGIAALWRGATGLWWPIVGGIATIAVDKWFDLQSQGYAFAKWVRDRLDGPLDLHSQREAWRAGVLLVALALVLAGALWLARADRRLDRHKVLALFGLLVVGALVLVRLVPHLSLFAEEWFGWACEAGAALLVAAGLRGQARAPLPHSARN